MTLEFLSLASVVAETATSYDVQMATVKQNPVYDEDEYSTRKNPVE